MEHAINPWILLVLSLMIALTLTVLSILGTRNLRMRPEGNRQHFVELVVSSLNNFTIGIIGPQGERYTPFIGTLFIYILAMNLLGLVPGFHSPTGNLSTTLSLALVVFVMYNYWGIRAVGGKNYLKHLAGEPLWLAPLMLPVHIFGEIARPVSLALRLFGNVFGKEVMLGVFAGMTWVIIPYFVAIPTQFPMTVFAVFISFVQALVFALLTCVYIAIAITHDEDAHG